MDAIRKQLAAEYIDRIGYDPFEDDPSITLDEVRNALRDYDEEVRACAS